MRIREVFGQCGKAVIRAKLWDGDSRGLADAVTLGGDFYTLSISESAAMVKAVATSNGSDEPASCVIA